MTIAVEKDRDARERGAVLRLRHLDMPSQQLAGQPDIPNVAEKVDVPD